MKSGADVEEADPEDSGSGCGFGCALAIIALIVGIGLAWYQSKNIEDTWAYCMHADPDSVELPQGQDVGQASWSALFIRIAAYSLCFSLSFYGGRKIMRRRSSAAAIISGTIASIALCSVLFVSDFALFNGMSRVSNIEKYCPDGRPPWWPSLLPERVSRIPLSPVYRR